MIAGEKNLTQPRRRPISMTLTANRWRSARCCEIRRTPRRCAKIAVGGADAFYTGDIARDIVETANTHPANPGDLTLADLASYKAVVREAVCDSYRSYRVCGFPLPSSGGLTVLQMLKMLEPYDLNAMGAASFWSVHFFSEAGRLAYADRSVYEADPAFYSPPAGLLDDAYLRVALGADQTRCEPRPREAGRPACDARAVAQGRTRPGCGARVSRRRRTFRSSTAMATPWR